MHPEKVKESQRKWKEANPDYINVNRNLHAKNGN